MPEQDTTQLQPMRSDTWKLLEELSGKQQAASQPQPQSWQDVLHQLGSLAQSAIRVPFGPNLLSGDKVNPYSKDPQEKKAAYESVANSAFGALTMPEGFYSHAEKVLGETKQGLWQGQQLINYLKAKGVKDEELKFSGLLRLKDLPKTTRDEALSILKNEAPGLNEKTLSNNWSLDNLPEGWKWKTRNGRTTDGDPYFAIEGPNGRLLRAVSENDIRSALADYVNGPQYEHDSSLRLPGPSTNYKEILLAHRPSEIPDATGQVPFLDRFNQSHWSEPNVVAHLRTNLRKTPTGDMVQHIEEAQSDWANLAHERGIEDPNKMEWHPNQPEKNPVPDAPYIRGSWNELAAKRALLEAARNPEVKHVTWTTGEQQAERYSLDKHYSEIRYDPSTKYLNAWPIDVDKPGPRNAAVIKKVEPEDLHKWIGRELAQKLLAAPDTAQYAEVFNDRFGGSAGRTKLLQGPDLKVLDEGKRKAYDVVLKSNMKRLTKQEPRLVDIEGQVDTAADSEEKANQILNLPKETRSSQKVWGIQMTPELRAKILKEGFPLYSLAPLALLPSHKQQEPLPPPPSFARVTK